MQKDLPEDGTRPPGLMSRARAASRTLFHCAPSIRLSALDILALALVVAYGALCASTIMQAYRTYEELFAFETDGPFYLIRLDDLVHGRIDEMFIYGGFPILAAYLFSLPLLLFDHFSGHANHVASLIIGFRLSQTFFTALSAWFVYRIAASLASRLLGVICLLSFVSLNVVLRWTALLHPDVQQLAMTLASCYLLIEYCRSGRLKHFVMSAVFAGFATACKYFGVFLIPAAMIAILAADPPQAPIRAWLLRAVRRAAIYAVVHTAAFLSTNPQIFKSAFGNFQYTAAAVENVLAPGSLFSMDLWQRKALLLFDDTLLGAGMCVAFVTIAAFLIARSIVRRRVDRVHVLTAFIVSYFLVFFVFWRDVFNIAGGHRYLMQVAALVPIVIATGLHDAGARFGPTGRAAAAAAAVVILILGVLTPWGAMASARARSIQAVVKYLWNREATGRFQVKQWIERNLPPGSRILTQAYLNIELPADIPGSRYEPGSRWRGTKDIKVFYDPSNVVYITPVAVASINPDFIFFANQRTMEEILAAFPDYRLIATIGQTSAAYVLARKDAPPLQGG